MNQQTGKMLLAIGVFIIIAGLIVYFFHDHLKWIGKLPGDIRIERENFRFYFPITTMVILSIVLSLLIFIFRKIH
ncbi:MAG: DUF2905 domain-containing protein [Ginsengibacter sp.]|jgi:uncharacterized protein HemY